MIILYDHGHRAYNAELSVQSCGILQKGVSFIDNGVLTCDLYFHKSRMKLIAKTKY